MADPAKKIDSDGTGLSFAEEESFGVLPGSPIWYDLEPNKYSNFGGEIKTLARNPINPSRQLKKGVTVDEDASGGFSTDLTQTNLQKLLQGFFFADLRTKDELDIATVDDSPDAYNPAAGGDGYVAGDLLFAKGFDDAGNNGLKVVTGTPTSTEVQVTTPLTAAATQTGVISRVGHQFATGDASTTTVGDFPALNFAVFDPTGLDLIPGEWVFVGGDDTGEKFATAESNGFCRVRAVDSDKIEFDKTPVGFAADAGTGKTIRLFLGRVLKNETGDEIVRRTYQLERTLGAPDLDAPTDLQAEYLVGAVPNEATFNISPADKLTVDLSFVGKDVEQNSADDGLKSGTHVPVVEASAFNTTSDLSRVRLSRVDDDTDLVVYFTDLKLTLNNHVTPDKAVGVLGAFEVTAGVFEVTGSMTAFFTDVAAIAAVRENDDITLDFIAVRENAGIAFDLPLVTVGDGRPDVKQNDPIKIPLTLQAATGAKIDPALDHTFLMVFFDYLPDLAE